MPFGGEHDRALGRDGVLPLLLQWGCVQGHSSCRGNPCHPTQGGHSPECPANTSWHPHKGSYHRDDCGAPIEKRPPKKFPGWKRVLHPSRPIVATGGTSPLSRGLKRRPHSWSMGWRLVWQPQTEEPGVSTTQPEAPLPTNKMEAIWQVMLPPGFIRVTACLQRDQSMEGLCIVPLDLLMIEVISVPAVAMMSTSCIMRDEVTGVTYMDTVATSVGRVTLSGSKQETLAQGPTIQDITDLV